LIKQIKFINQSLRSFSQEYNKNSQIFEFLDQLPRTKEVIDLDSDFNKIIVFKNLNFYEANKSQQDDLLSDKKVLKFEIRKDFDSYALFILFSFIYENEIKFLNNFQLINQYFELFEVGEPNMNMKQIALSADFIYELLKEYNCIYYKGGIIDLELENMLINFESIDSGKKDMLNNLINEIKNNSKKDGYKLYYLFLKKEGLEIIFKNLKKGELVVLLLNDQKNHYFESKNFNISYKGTANDEQIVFIDKMSQLIKNFDDEYNILI